MAKRRYVIAFFLVAAFVVVNICRLSESFIIGHFTERSNEVTSASSATTSNVLSSQSTQSQRKNVLFIIVDDLRPQLGAYHDPKHADYFSKLRIRTPNLDKFASESMVFRHAYVQYSLCGPSRTSLLTSRRPDVTRVYGNRVYWREVGGNFTTLPQHFKNNGYLTVGLGKVFHPGMASNNNDPISWTEAYYIPPTDEIKLLPNGRLTPWLAVSQSQMEDTELVDVGTTKMAVSLLKRMSEKAKSWRQPFFMAVGYHRPHRSMVCPEKYFRLYPLEDKNQFLVNRSWQEPTIRKPVKMDGIETIGDRRYLPSDRLRNVRRAYFACISYVDQLVGEVLQALDDYGLKNSTVVSFMADHGFHLGENGQWGKVLTSEIANRIPLIIRIPGLTNNGASSSSIVEAIDVFPTIVEAAGLNSLPSCPANNSNVRLCAQGTSLMPIFHDPQHILKDAAFSQSWKPDGMSYSIRTKHFRFVDRAFIDKTNKSQTSHVLVTWSSGTDYSELYDYRNDILEQFNLVNSSEYKDTMINLRNRLHQFVQNQFL